MLINYIIIIKLIKSNFNSLQLNNGLIDLDSLNSNQRRIVENIKTKFNSINTEVVGLGRTHLAKHTIDTGEHQPIKQRYYPLSPVKQKRLEDELDRMLKLNIVSPSQSPWNSPVVMIENSNGSTRLCLDSRKLNEVTKPDAYPLPYISQILDNLRDAKYLSSIDLSSAYWQIPFDGKSSADKTAFTVLYCNLTSCALV